MNTEIVADAARATLSGGIPFPEVVRRRIETGVELLLEKQYRAVLRG
jgi:hypothetical protein